MSPNVCEQSSSAIFSLSQEQIEYIADKILYNKSLNAADRRLIYFAVTGDLESKSYFCKKRGPKTKSLKHIKLAEDVDKLKENGCKISKGIKSLGEKHNLQGAGDVSLDTFNKNLKSGRVAQKSREMLKRIRAARKIK